MTYSLTSTTSFASTLLRRQFTRLLEWCNIKVYIYSKSGNQVNKETEIIQYLHTGFHAPISVMVHNNPRCNELKPPSVVHWWMMETVYRESSSNFHLLRLTQHHVVVHSGQNPKPHTQTHKMSSLHCVCFQWVFRFHFASVVPPPPYPSVGEDRITLLNQDGFDHGGVHCAQ